MGTVVNISNKNQQQWNGFIWSNLINGAMRRKANSQKENFFSKNNKSFFMEVEKQEPKKRIRVLIGLGAKHSDIYFTKREAECVVWLLKGKKFSEIATILNLSSRTVEYYMQNIKAKVGCRTKLELIDMIQASDFKKTVNFQE
jgi:DNA-binding CsgD family transcriptional regulator